MDGQKTRNQFLGRRSEERRLVVGVGSGSGLRKRRESEEGRDSRELHSGTAGRQQTRGKEGKRKRRGREEKERERRGKREIGTKERGDSGGELLVCCSVSRESSSSSGPRVETTTQVQVTMLPRHVVCVRRSLSYTITPFRFYQATARRVETFSGPRPADSIQTGGREKRHPSAPARCLIAIAVFNLKG